MNNSVHINIAWLFIAITIICFFFIFNQLSTSLSSYVDKIETDKEKIINSN